jgi:hypothetical protein
MLYIVKALSPPLPPCVQPVGKRDRQLSGVSAREHTYRQNKERIIVFVFVRMSSTILLKVLMVVGKITPTLIDYLFYMSSTNIVVAFRYGDRYVGAPETSLCLSEPEVQNSGNLTPTALTLTAAEDGCDVDARRRN